VRSALYEGTLLHARTTPARNVFRYPVCFYALDLDELPELDRRLRLFGYNRRNVVTFRDGDHLGLADRPVKENLLAYLDQNGIALAGGRIVLITNLRLLGYVFNPVSYFYCYGAGGELVAIVAEVGNTFGERHPYLLTSDNQVGDGARSVYEHAKRMHVSPFFGMDQTYRFSFTEPGERIHAGVGIIENGTRPFWAELTGRRRPLTNASLARALTRYPLMSQQVIGLIHWQAVKLAMKRVPLHRKPRFAPGQGSLRAHANSSPAQGSLQTHANPSPTEGSLSAHASASRNAAAPAPRRELRPLPPAVRSPLTPAARRLAMWALAHPARGQVSVTLPDGSIHRGGDPATGPSVDVVVRSRNLWRRLATRGRLALGESYAAGDWSADDLVGLLEILALTAESARTSRPGQFFTRALRHRPRLPARSDLPGAKRDIQYHYDLGNDLYGLFLDPSWTYSCAFFERTDMTLEQAQEAKYRRICEKLGLGPGSHVLEIGCGWGGFALHAAGEWGARVTGLTLSQEQAALGRERVQAAGLSDRVEIRLQDYRTLEGRFSHIASIEMLEAIGHRELPVFFRACNGLLAPEGIACIQTIAVPDQRYERYRRGNDWIREYVFPGALIPSLEAVSRAMTRSSELIVHGVENIGFHYAETLRQWRERFLSNREAVLALGYDERFVRTWEFYLAFCEAGFRTRALHDYQLVLTRPFNHRLPTDPVARVTF
jgi:cyclopropane-fatty-acyl-phospholipid synthase